MDAPDVAVLDHMVASGEIVPAQLPVVTSWSPSKRLAAAVLASALINLRDHCGDAAHRRHVEEDLAWVASDEIDGSFSFLRLCDVFALEPDWVRQVVARWRGLRAAGVRTPLSLHRHAA